MTPEEFIRYNPFPENGTELNMQLVADIQNPVNAHLREQNLNKLFKLNARLVWVVYKQHNYGEELASVMSFVYEGIRKSVDSYNPSIGMPFYNYVIQTTRSLIQHYYNYHSDVIHVPVRKQKDENFIYEYSDINDTVEELFIATENDIDKKIHNIDLDKIIELYECRDLTMTEKHDLIALKLIRTTTIEDISSKTGKSKAKIRAMVERASEKLKKYMR